MKKTIHFILLLTIFHFFFFGVGFVTTASAQNMAGGYDHTMSLCNDGTVSAWGSNLEGQLGNETNVNSATPVPVSDLTDVVAISSGRYHGMALKDDGTLWVWGYNEYAQLGNGTQVNSNVPIQVPGLTDVIAMDASLHVIILKSDSTVWTWGYNSYGQIGDGTFSNTPTLSPIQIPGLSGISAVEAAFNFTMALKSDGTVWTWGTDSYGQLGNGFSAGSFTPVQASNLTNVVEITASDQTGYARKADGTVWAWGFNETGALGNGTYDVSYAPIQVAGLSDIISIDDGGSFALFLKSDGTVWTVGDNFFGQLGIGSNGLNSATVVQVTSLSDVVAIEAGTFTCYAIKNDNTVWGWGRNNENQVSSDDVLEINSPVQIMGICAEIINVEDGNKINSQGFTVYPNPTSDDLFLRFNDSASNKITGISITDNIGKQLWQSTQVMQNVPIDVSHLSEGVYTVVVQYAHSSTYQTFVKTR